MEHEGDGDGTNTMDKVDVKRTTTMAVKRATGGGEVGLGKTASWWRRLYVMAVPACIAGEAADR